jgi:TrmH family RNA methyltransferase
MPSPILILVSPQDIVNIASSVRIAKNFGIERMRLVNPEVFDPYRIEGIAHNTADLVARIEILSSLAEAVADCVFTAVLTARGRTAKRRTLRPREAAEELVRESVSGPVAIVVGREDRGLTNAELDLGHALVTIPTDPGHSSLNLAQAVAVMAYESWIARGGEQHSFKHALRAALREDPDIILVGEMRDLETVSIAIETAETGHLVFGTLHTTTASSTIDRIIDQFPADRQSQVRVMLSESLRGVIAQTLCKKIGGGRVAAREILLSIPAVSNLIREGKTFQIPSIMQTNRKTGMVTLNDSLMELVDSKQVEPKEAYMKSVDKAGFAAGLKAKRHDVSFLGEG